LDEAHDSKSRYLNLLYSFNYSLNSIFSLLNFFFLASQCEVRYRDEIQCAAGRVVYALRSYALSKNISGNGEFHSLHVRRGDFLYIHPPLAPDPSFIYSVTQDVLPEGSILYIATNEQNKSFFQPLRDHYDIKFLDDFVDDLNTPQTIMDPNYYGMIDQLVVGYGRFY
jgi:hypothetical protein